MKKLLKLSALVLIVLLLATTLVSAATTKAELKDEVTALVSKLKLERDHTAEINTIFSKIDDLSEEDLSQITARLNAVDEKLEEYEYDLDSVPKSVKDRLFEVAQEEILGSGQLILDVTPIYNEEKDCYAWNYKIVNTSYIANGGEFKNNPFEYKTAILRALFKGLKFIIDSEHIYTKTILIRGCDESILKCIEKNVDEQENQLFVLLMIIKLNWYSQISK